MSTRPPSPAARAMVAFALVWELFEEQLQHQLDEASERDHKGRLRWLRADGTRP